MVATILELLEAGASALEIRKGYPAITPAHIRAALHYAHQLLEQGQVIILQHTSHAISR